MRSQSTLDKSEQQLHLTMKRLITFLRKLGRMVRARLTIKPKPEPEPIYAMEEPTLTTSTVTILLKNTLPSGNLFAHVTGQDSQGLFILSADGQTPYRPTSPDATLQPLRVDTAISLGGPGESRKLTVPHIFGARIWFCRDVPLRFFLNPGPALVEPSATNVLDENYDRDWGFCEFTFNQSELYVNVSYVDFVSLPIGLQLENQEGSVRRVEGMPADGLLRVAQGLETQAQQHSAGWDKLVVKSKDGQHLRRVLSPNAGGLLFPGTFDGYYSKYVDAVWDKYSREDLIVNTQYTWGDVVGRVNDGGVLVFSNNPELSFGKPLAEDIFSCSTGPFAGGPKVPAEKLNIGARLAAGLNRSTLLVNGVQPEGERVEKYYKEVTTNHYSRVCHETTREGRGYAFPYDDVGRTGGDDQSGFLNDPRPKVLTVVVGGGSF